MQIVPLIETLFFLSSVVALVAFSALRSVFTEEWLKVNDSHEEVTLNRTHALLLPLFSSFSLLLLYYFFQWMSFISFWMVCFSASLSIAFVLQPYLRNILGLFGLHSEFKYDQIYFCRKLNHFSRTRLCGAATSDWIASTFIGICTVISWLITGHFWLNNVLGASLAISSISFIRLPNLKVCSLLLFSLFLYDIFWVFYSSNLFGENVMVEVARKAADNPGKLIAEKFNFGSQVVPTLHLPMKFIFSSMMLGLGDVVIPGLLISFLKKFDFFVNGRDQNGYFYVGLVGYTAGLLMSMFMSVLFEAAQPALLYIVPLTVGPSLYLAWRRGQFFMIWSLGIENDHADSKKLGLIHLT